MDLDWFNDLKHLSDTASFSRAAELSNVSQPTLSRRIKAVEAWAGVRLVDRSNYPIRLTDAGKQIQEAAEQALSRLESERQLLLDAETQPDKYVVTFGAQHSIAWRFYPKWLQAFEDAYEPMLSQLRATDLPTCLNDLCNGDIDFAIGYQALEYIEATELFTRTEQPHPALQSISIGKDKLIPVCKPLSDGTPSISLSINDNLNNNKTPLLNYGSDAYLGELLKSMLQQSGIDKQLYPVYENSMAGALRIRARDGMGLAWLPQSLVMPDLESGVLCQLNEQSLQIALDIRLIRNPSCSNVLTRHIWSCLHGRQKALIN